MHTLTNCVATGQTNCETCKAVFPSIVVYSSNDAETISGNIKLDPITIQSRNPHNAKVLYGTDLVIDVPKCIA